MVKYTREQQKTLFRQAQAGDRASLEALMRQHERLVHAVVQRQWSGGWRYADVVHEGRLGLWRAILNYDPDRGTAFSTYAWPAIARQVWRAVQGRQAEEAPEQIVGKERRVEDVADQVAWHAIRHTVRETVTRLPAKERWVVARYYGLDGRGGTTNGAWGNSWAARSRRSAITCTRRSAACDIRAGVRSCVRS